MGRWLDLFFPLHSGGFFLILFPPFALYHFSLVTYIDGPVLFFSFSHCFLHTLVYWGFKVGLFLPLSFPFLFFFFFF